VAVNGVKSLCQQPIFVVDGVSDPSCRVVTTLGEERELSTSVFAWLPTRLDPRRVRSLF